MLKENLLILCFVAITEFVFFTFFSQNYLSIDPNIIRRKCITIFGDNSSQNSMTVDEITNKVSSYATNINNINKANNVLNEISNNSNIKMIKEQLNKQSLNLDLNNILGEMTNTNNISQKILQ